MTDLGPLLSYLCSLPLPRLCRVRRYSLRTIRRGHPHVTVAARAAQACASQTASWTSSHPAERSFPGPREPSASLAPLAARPALALMRCTLRTTDSSPSRPLIQPGEPRPRSIWRPSQSSSCSKAALRATSAQSRPKCPLPRAREACRPAQQKRVSKPKPHAQQTQSRFRLCRCSQGVACQTASACKAGSLVARAVAEQVL